MVRLYTVAAGIFLLTTSFLPAGYTLHTNDQGVHSGQVGGTGAVLTDSSPDDVLALPDETPPSSVLLSHDTLTATTIPVAPDTTDGFVISPDDPIANMLDSLAALKVFRILDELSGEGIVRKHGYEPGYVPSFPDSVYRHRLALMNDASPFDFVYNGWVKSYIELYGNRRRQLTERMLGLGTLYFHFFEEQLDRYNIPLELKYLAVIESALNPVARSRAGASGIWQFMFQTGRMYGLNTSSYVDDRNDVTLSTIAACRHLADLYNIYEDWSLVLAAYNAGPGNVNRAIRRAGGVKDFWLIRHLLPRETQNYVPAFIAVAYVMTHAEDHNLYPVPPLYTSNDVDTIHVRSQLNLRTLSELLDIPLDHLRFLNPAYRQNIIPKRDNNPYVLILPNDRLSVFLANEENIYNFRTPEAIRQEELAARMQETTVYVVRQGDNLGSIARRHNTTVREIQTLNNLRGTLIRPGQRLVVSGPPASTTPVASSATAATSQGETAVHIVKRGETLAIIARTYRISVNNLMHWNNLSGSLIHPGQRLVVRPPTGS